MSSKPEPEEGLRGVFPILATPYTSHKALDYEDLQAEVEFLLSCRVPGIVWPQLAGDTFNLSPAERMRGMQVLAQAVRGRPTELILGVDGPNLKTALQYLEHANSLNPAALIAMAPYQARSVEEVIDYYHQLARATSRPLFVQNSDLQNGVKPDIPSLVQLARDHPNCAFFKEEIPPALERNLELTRHRPLVKRIFSGGGGRTLIQEMEIGIDGVMAGNAYADIFVQVWQLFHSEQKARAAELHAKVVQMLDLEKEVPLTRRYILKRRGVFKTEIGRKEQGDLTPEQIRTIEQTFEPLRPYLQISGAGATQERKIAETRPVH